ncbi:MAG: porphobilinogen synthase [Clostridia bacterium]|nr:porphobilinogen synthase [Clostridia bacterium]MDD4048606.1 porphobilinogen synthase [Clostridia bacterium]
MSFPYTRMRRLRKSSVLRNMVREVEFSTNDLIYPMFVTHGKGIKNPVESLPGIYQFSIDTLLFELENVVNAGIPSIILFGIPEKKDSLGSEAYADDGIIQQAITRIKKEYPDLIVVSDVCLCEYTDHGHCGVVKNGKILNDITLDFLVQVSLSHARAGVDIIAPSDMMDGRIGAIREALNRDGYEDVLLMSYSVKYASSFNGPFREAVGTVPKFGDRSTYQMDYRTGWRQALRETALDLEEGADIIMVKPALAYMDIIRKVRDECLCPIATFNVSGEYAMLKAAAMKGWIDEKKVVMEIMSGFKRAGADLILTYSALDIARWLKELD